MASNRYSLKDTVLAPLICGVLYAVGEFLPRGLRSQDFYWQSPFMFTALAGLLIAFACRPVLSRLQWMRRTAFGMGLLIVLSLGQAGDIASARIASLLGAAPYPLSLPYALLPTLGAALFISVGMTLLYCPKGGRVGPFALWGSVTAHDPQRLMLRLAVVSAFYVVIQLGVGWLDLKMVWSWGVYETGIIQPNAWAQFTAPTHAAGPPIFFMLLWLRGFVRLLPLMLIGVTLRGQPMQIALVFGMLWFVLGSFVPLVVDQPYPSPVWLIGVVAWDVAEAGVMAMITARAIRPFYHAPF